MSTYRVRGLEGLPMADSRVEHWIRVPDDSTLRITARGTTKTEIFSATADWLDSTNRGNEQSIDTLGKKPFKLLLTSPRSYAVDVILAFLTGATATVEAEVLKPDGSRHGKPYSIAIKGKKGQIEFVSLFLFTVQP